MCEKDAVRSKAGPVDGCLIGSNRLGPVASGLAAASPGIVSQHVDSGGLKGDTSSNVNRVRGFLICLQSHQRPRVVGGF